MSSSRKTFTTRIRSRLHTVSGRIFFWLPSRTKSEESEATPDTKDHKLLLSVTRPRRLPGLRQIRYIGRVLSSAERRSVALLLAITLVSTCTAAFFAVRAQTNRVPAIGGTLVEALIGEPSYINPLDAPANDVDQDLTSLIFSGLFRLDGTDPVPDLAESAEWSDDQKTLTVVLREDAIFHSGDHVIAEDVLYTIDAIQDPQRSSPLASKFRGVQIGILDGRTVQFVLESPNPLFEHALTAGILPARLWQEIPPANARLSNLNVKPIGSGPYRFKSFTHDSRGFIRSYTLERFEDYYGSMPYIQTLVFQFYPDRQQAEEALKADLVDALAFSSLGDGVQESTRRNTVSVNLPQETVAFFNLNKEIFKNEDVRKALIGVVDRQEIVDAWKGRAVPVHGPFPFAQTDAAIVTLDEARTLLDGAGWKIQTDESIRTGSSTSSKFEFTILTSNMSSLMETAETLKRRWSLLGASVTVESVSPEELLRRATRERNADVIITNVLLDSEQNLFPFWWSGQATDRGFNISNLADRDVDAALEAVQAADTRESLDAKRVELTQTILNAEPAVFLVRPASTYLLSKKVKGVDAAITIAKPSDRFRHLMKWYLKSGWEWKTE